VVRIRWGDASRAQRAGFLAALGVGAAVRVAYLASKWDQELLLNDSLWYSAQAVVLARGDGFADPFYGGPSAEHGPLTPIVLAAVSWIDDPVPWQRLVMTVIGIATVAAIGLLAVRLAGWWAGVAAAGIAAVYPNLWMNDALVMSETLATAGVVVVLWLTLDLAMEPRASAGRALACGVTIGLAALARSELLLLAPIMAGVVWWARRRDVACSDPATSARAVSDPASSDAAVRDPGSRDRASLLLLGGAALAVLPWVVPNLVRFDRPVLLTTNDGTTLLGANCPDSWSGADIGGWSLFCVVDAGAPEGEDPAVRSARHRRLAAEYVLDHVERVPLVVAARVGRGLDVVGLENLVAADVGEERPRWASWAGIVCWWALALLAVVGARALPSTPRAVMLAPVVGVLVTTIVFYGGHRIRTPIEPVVAVLAGVAIGSKRTEMRPVSQATAS
jgi:hypothetical protein